MLEKEIERVGIPAVLITALTPTAKTLAVNRVVQGVAITNPVGNPRISYEEERALRRKIVESALDLLTREMEGWDQPV